MTRVFADLTGALLIDKPTGPTSHDIVAFARRLLHTPRVGHTGTLDPLATGLLVLLIGPATRLARFVSGDDKEYIADVRLGLATPTYDAQSLDEAIRVRENAAGPAQRGVRVRPEDLEAALDRFRGTFMQTPPPFSAKKVAGVRAYESARRNDPVELKPVQVTVRELERLPASHPDSALIRLRVAATSGFYVRSLAHDLGQVLGCGAHLEALRRTRAGQFRVEDAATLDTLEAAGAAAADRLLSVNVLLADFPAVTVTEEGLRRATNGNPLSPGHLEKGGCPLFQRRPPRFAGENGDPEQKHWGLSPEKGTATFFRVLDGDGGVLAVAEGRADGLLHPLVILR